MERDDRDERFDAFCTTYGQAWEATAYPEIDGIQETFVEALDPEGVVNADLHPLLVFFRAELARNTPLNWFCGTATMNRVRGGVDQIRELLEGARVYRVRRER